MVNLSTPCLCLRPFVAECGIHCWGVLSLKPAAGVLSAHMGALCPCIRQYISCLQHKTGTAEALLHACLWRWHDAGWSFIKVLGHLPPISQCFPFSNKSEYTQCWSMTCTQQQLSFTTIQQHSVAQLSSHPR